MGCLVTTTKSSIIASHDLSFMVAKSFKEPIRSPLGSVSSTASPPSSSASGQRCSNCGTTKTPLWRRAPDGSLICNACGLYYKANNCHRPVNLKRPPRLVKLDDSCGSGEGSCKGDGRCNGTGGAAACKGCPVYNNRVIITKSEGNSELETDINDQEMIKQEISPKLAKVEHLYLSEPPNDLEIPSSARGSAPPINHDSSVAIACANCQTTITPLWRRNDLGETICNACGLYYKLHGCHRPIKMKSRIIKRRKRAPILSEDRTGALDSMDHESNPQTIEPSSKKRSVENLHSQSRNELKKSAPVESPNHYEPNKGTFIASRFSQASPVKHEAKISLPPLNIAPKYYYELPQHQQPSWESASSFYPPFNNALYRYPPEQTPPYSYSSPDSTVQRPLPPYFHGPSHTQPPVVLPSLSHLSLDSKPNLSNTSASLPAPEKTNNSASAQRHHLSISSLLNNNKNNSNSSE